MATFFKSRIVNGMGKFVWLKDDNKKQGEGQLLKTAKNRIQKEKIKKAAAREDVPQRHRRGGGQGSEFRSQKTKELL